MGGPERCDGVSGKAGTVRCRRMASAGGADPRDGGPAETKLEGAPEAGVELEARPEDSDDASRHGRVAGASIQVRHSTDHAGIATMNPPPVGVGHHHHGLGARNIVFLIEKSS